MKTYNHTTYAILGILTTNCRSGYAIKQLIDRSLNHFWKISYGQIYPTLKRIVDEGLAEVRDSSGEGKRDKQEYTLTSKGMETLGNWLSEPVEQPPLEKNEILLKLFFGRHQSTDHTMKLLTDYKGKLQERLATYVTIEEGILNQEERSEDVDYWLFTLDYGKRGALASIDWCDATLEKLYSKEEHDGQSSV